MFDHVAIRVKDLAASRRLYEAALAPLGYKIVAEYPGMVGFGHSDESDLWIGTADAGLPGQARTPLSSGLHIAVRSPDRGSVDAFHAAALAAGGRDNGAPGVRAVYHPSYYGAFVWDLDGNNIEAVCHTPA